MCGAAREFELARRRKRGLRREALRGGTSPNRGPSDWYRELRFAELSFRTVGRACGCLFHRRGTNEYGIEQTPAAGLPKL